jgi:hypothetical protein
VLIITAFIGPEAPKKPGEKGSEKRARVERAVGATQQDQDPPRLPGHKAHHAEAQEALQFVPLREAALAKLVRQRGGIQEVHRSSVALGGSAAAMPLK